MLSVKKANYGPVGQEIRVRWDRGVFVPVISSPAAARAIEARADRVFMDMLARYSVEGRNVAATTGANYAPAVFAVDKRSEGQGKHLLADAMNRLFAADQIAIEEVGPPSRRRKHIVIVNGCSK